MTGGLPFALQAGIATTLALLFRDGPAAARAEAERADRACPDHPLGQELRDIVAAPRLDGATAERAARLAESLELFFLAAPFAAQRAIVGDGDPAWDRAATHLGIIADEADRAAAAVEAGDWERAFALYERLHQHGRFSLPHWVRLVDCGLRLGRVERCAELCRALGRVDWDCPNLLQAWGEVLAAQGDIAAAVEVLQECDHPGVRENAGMYLLMFAAIAGDTATGRRHLHWIATPGRRAPAQAMLDLADGDIAAARAALAGYERMGLALNLRGIMAERQGDLDSPAALYEEALRQAPEAPLTLLNLAGLARRRQDFPLAEHYWTRARAANAGVLAWRQRLRLALLGETEP